jgi:serpin B
VAAQGWSVVLEAPAYERLELRMPRFTVRSSARLGEVLSGLGMPTAFTDQADFSGFTREGLLRISEVLHEAFVDVDELGTEAAAATAVVMPRAAGVPEPPVPFVVDRPFLFAVHTVDGGVPVFVGRVSDPR